MTGFNVKLFFQLGTNLALMKSCISITERILLQARRIFLLYARRFINNIEPREDKAYRVK